MIEPPRTAYVEAFQTAVIRLEVSRDQLAHVIGPAIFEIMAVLSGQGVNPTGHCFTFHLQKPAEIFEFEVGFPVDKSITSHGRVCMSSLPAGMVLQSFYKGPYEGLQESLTEFWSWIESSGFKPSGGFFERFLIGPFVEPDSSKWKTELNCCLEG